MPNSLLLQEIAETRSRDEVRVLNELLDPARRLVVPAGDETWVVRFDARAADTAAMAAFARLQWEEGEALVAVDGFGFSGELEAVIGEAPLRAKLPDALLAAVVEHLLARAPEGMNLRLGGASLRGWPDGADAEAYPVRLGFTVAAHGGAAGASAARGVLACDAALAARLAGALAPDPDAPETPSFDVPLVGQVQLRSIQLDPDLFAGLAPLDILLPGGHLPGGPLLLRIFFASGAYCFGRLEGETIIMQAQEPATGPAEEQGGESPKAPPMDFSKVPVRISFELGQVTLSLAQLRSVAEGTCLEIPAPAADGVVIKANGREIGRGALVRIEDHVGVRILELFKEP